MNTWHDADQSRSPLIAELYAIWKRKRGDAELPRRADFEPAEMKRLLPNLIIAEIEAEPLRVRYRLVGTKVAAASGFDFSGRYLDEIDLATGAENWLAQYREILASRRPLFGRAEVPTVDGGSFGYEFALFPVTTDGRSVNQCLEIEDYGAFNDRLSELQKKVEGWRPAPITVKKDRPGP
ncbi:MAG: hypothetical protein BroJett029_26460 [Alphaproteobacteria bacterium]|nr:MAG: hypothetical protein BroJett029_26460 [Alphaproteobacteria bacterium]